MAHYEYHCRECGIWISVTHSITGEISIECSQCKEPMIQPIYGTHAIYKGAGWAKKDRRDGGKQ